MALNLGDAFLTFRGDLTQLNLAFQDIEGAAQEKLAPAQAQVDALATGLDRVATEAEQAAAALASAGATGSEAGAKVQTAWQAVAKATVENYQAQQELSKAMYAVKSTAGDSAEAVSRLALAQERAATTSAQLTEARAAATADFNKASAAEQKIGNEAVATEALLAESFGVKIPRHLRGFVAELPGVGMALNAAFSAVAVLMLIQIGAEALEKFKEWRQEAELQRQDWIKLQGTFHDTNESIQQDIEQQERKFIELTQGPVAGLEYAFTHLRSTADAELKKIISELDEVADHFKKQDHIWDIGIGNAGEVSADLKKFGADLQEAMRGAAQESPNDPTAAYRKGIQLTETAIGDLTAKIKDLKSTTVDLGEGITQNANINTTALEKQLEALNAVNDALEKGIKLDDKTKQDAQEQLTRAAQQREQELGDARINAAKSTAEKLLALHDDESRRAYEHGQISYAQEIQALKDSANRKYEIDKSALEQQLALDQNDPTKNAAAIFTLNGQLQDLEIEHKGKLEQIDDQANKKRAADYLASLETQIAATRQGSQERIDLEEQVAAFLKKTHGEESTDYQQQLQKVAAAQRAHSEELKKIAQTEAQGEEALSRDKSQAAIAYYQYLVSTARASLAQVARIQRDAEEQEFVLRRASLERDLQSHKEEGADRTRILEQLALLDQQLAEKRVVWGLQANDTLELSFRQLGLSSAASYKRQAEIAHDAYAHILLSGKATYSELLQAQMALMKAEIQEKQASGQNVTRDIANLHKLEQEYARLKLGLSQVSAGMRVAQTLFKSLGLDADLLDQKLGAVGNTSLVVAAAASTMALAWAQGGQTIAQAAEQMAESVLQSIAKMAFAKGTAMLAEGWADLADPATAALAPAAFTSAAEWFAAGGLASIVSGTIANASNGHSSGSGSSSAASGVSVAPGDATPATNPTPVTNIQRFATGGLVSSPTLALIGDSISSASRAASEAILPLEDPRAMSRIAGAITAQMGGGGGGTVNHFHIEGMISDDKLDNVIRKINRRVQNNGVKLTASNALRVTKKA